MIFRIDDDYLIFGILIPENIYKLEIKCYTIGVIRLL